MNWKEIKEKYPKAYGLLTKNGEYSIQSGCLFLWVEHIAYHYELRDLYDFFDEQGIYISIKIGSDFRHFDYSIHLKNIWKADSHGDSIRKTTRTEAETEAFTKAFEILEDSIG